MQLLTCLGFNLSGASSMQYAGGEMLDMLPVLPVSQMVKLSYDACGSEQPMVGVCSHMFICCCVSAWASRQNSSTPIY